MIEEKEDWVEVPLDLTNEEILFFALEAHKRDIKLNDLLVEILRNAVAEYEDKLKSSDE